MINYKNEDKWLITVDLDGTFLGNGGNLAEPNFNFHPNNLEVIKKLEEQGHKVAIVTGRPWKDTQKVYEALGLKSMIANFNGAYIHNPTSDNFMPLSFSINPALLRELLLEEELKESLGSILIETMNHTYSNTNNVDDLVAKTFARREHYSIEPWTNGDKLAEPPLSVLAEIKLKEGFDHHNLLHKLNRKFGNSLFFRFWNGTSTEGNDWVMLEINQKASNKGTAMKYIAQYYNIPLTKTIAFGDGMNDREMLIDAAIGVAMKNAKGTVKTYANDITDYTNEEGGVGKYLEEFFNLK